jgi:hypothetical protein
MGGHTKPSTVPGRRSGSLTITSDRPTAARASEVVHAFANQLVRYEEHVAQTAYNTQIAKHPS